MLLSCEKINSLLHGLFLRLRVISLDLLRAVDIFYIKIMQSYLMLI